MGHNTLGRIPSSKRWVAVVEGISGGASPQDIAAASADAASTALGKASSDAEFVEAVRLLLSIPLAARSDDFGDALRRLGLKVGQQPDVLDLATAVSERMDAVKMGNPGRTDMGDISARALTATLSDLIGARLPGLFEATSGEVQQAARQLSYDRGVSVLVRSFFGRVLTESLSYWLDRTLSTQVGAGLRFANANARAGFDRDLATYVQESTRIIQEFSGGWYGKTQHRDGGFDTNAATIFGAVCLKKTMAELRRKDLADV